MTTEEAEKFLQVSGVRPTQTLVELVKSAWNKGYSDGRDRAYSTVINMRNDE